MAQAFDARRMAEAVAEVRYRMEQAAKAAGRDPGDILLCAVCKTRTPETIRDSAALPLSALTEGVHIHSLRCPDRETLEKAREALRNMGILQE